MNRLTPIAALCSVLPLAALARGDGPRDVPTDGVPLAWIRFDDAQDRYPDVPYF